MSDRTRAHCQNCGAHRDKVGPISWTGKCGACAEAILLENVVGLHTRSGVPWQRWRMGYARSLFGPEATAALDKAGYFRVPLDDVSETG
jgi:predicted ATP-dependent serine protease